MQQGQSRFRRMSRPSDPSLEILIPRQRLTTEDAPRRQASQAQTVRVVYERLLALVERVAPVMLRLSLAAVFIWFGALKLDGHSPVAPLIAATLPTSAPDLIVHVLGGVEVMLGVGLLIGRAQRLLLFALAGHLTGTFLTFVDAPHLMLQHGNPLLLTADGEFVLKNLVLISAAMLLIAHQGMRQQRQVLASTSPSTSSPNLSSLA